MHKGVNLVFLLVLGLAWTLEGVPVLPAPLFPTQENFDLSRFLGKWHDVAVASTCPYMQRHRGDAAIGTLELEAGSTNSTIKMTKIAQRGSVCKEINGDYQLTTTPGRFFYHIEKWAADVDAYVVHTNYDEYAIIIMKKQKTSGESTSVKLYSRTMDVRDTVLDDFKTLVRQQGMGDNTIIIKKNKGECVPGEQLAEPTTQPEPQRVKRNVVPSVPADDEGSGDDSTPLFRGPESCKEAPDAGPCFGMKPRYYYNSSAMACVTFNYGGCMGNQNNFVTERECLQTCRTEAVCRLPMVAHPCTGEPPVWAFDSASGLCLAYKQGFCQGNGNKFYSKAECEEYCGVVKDDADFLNAN